MKSVLLNANDDRGWPARYAAALAVVRGFSSHLTCIQSTPFADAGDSFFGYFPYPEVARELGEIARQHRVRTETRLRDDKVDFDWLEVMGIQSQMLIWRSGLADLTILTSGGKNERGPGTDELALAGSVAIHSRGPILAVPPDLTSFDPLGTALLAWNGSPEAANTFRAALPILAKAAKIIVVCVGEEDPTSNRFSVTEASAYLALHGLRSEDHPWDRDGRSVADVLLDAAAILGADYIVAGAYGHTRFREAVLGGSTRDLLHASSIPLVMAH